MPAGLLNFAAINHDFLYSGRFTTRNEFADGLRELNRSISLLIETKYAQDKTAVRVS